MRCSQNLQLSQFDTYLHFLCRPYDATNYVYEIVSKLPQYLNEVTEPPFHSTAGQNGSNYKIVTYTNEHSNSSKLIPKDSEKPHNKTFPKLGN